MQKEAEALLNAAQAFQKAGATEQQIRITPYVKEGLIQVTFTLPVTMEGLEMKIAQIAE